EGVARRRDRDRRRRQAPRNERAQLAASAQRRGHVVPSAPRRHAPRARAALSRSRSLDQRDLVPSRVLRAERVLPRVQAMDRIDAARAAPREARRAVRSRAHLRVTEVARADIEGRASTRQDVSMVAHTESANAVVDAPLPTYEDPPTWRLYQG